MLTSDSQKQGDTAGETLECEANHGVPRCGTVALNKEAQPLPVGGDEPCSMCVSKSRPCLVIRSLAGVQPVQRPSVSVVSFRRSTNIVAKRGKSESRSFMIVR